MDLIDPGTTAIAPNDLVTAKQVGDLLNRHYPDHLWAINCQWAQGVLTIQNLRLPARYGYVVRLVDSYSASDLEARAKRGAGEILERYRLDRGRIDIDQWSALPERAGQIVGDLS